ncbi:hypothetical protein Taro_008040 [Colocasia esculenta]|uniref:Transmembrane protein n=1 Tax=Colocasia esculenta TaxID=4460 RepID=A0A843U198_COLES|nr:hypothetical protein [Colocasia esculenta]
MVSRPRGVSRVWGGFACGPSTLWRSEVAVLVVRRRSHLVVSWSLREGCSCCYVPCVASVVAQCVRVVVARLAVDSLAVVFPGWRTVAGKSRRSAPGCLRRIWGFSRDCFALISAVVVLPQGLRMMPWWFWWRFSKDRLALLLLVVVFSRMVYVVLSFGWCILVKGCCHDALPRRNRVAVAVPFPVTMVSR